MFIDRAVVFLIGGDLGFDKGALTVRLDYLGRHILSIAWLAQVSPHQRHPQP